LTVLILLTVLTPTFFLGLVTCGLVVAVVDVADVTVMWLMYYVCDRWRRRTCCEQSRQQVKRRLRCVSLTSPAKRQQTLWHAAVDEVA